MKNQTCCFTGHREIPPEEISALRRALLKTVEGGVLYYGAGGARLRYTGGKSRSVPEAEIFPHPADTCFALPFPDERLVSQRGQSVQRHPAKGR